MDDEDVDEDVDEPVEQQPDDEPVEQQPDDEPVKQQPDDEPVEQPLVPVSAACAAMAKSVLTLEGAFIVVRLTCQPR